jgi:hypothetical protein
VLSNIKNPQLKDRKYTQQLFTIWKLKTKSTHMLEFISGSLKEGAKKMFSVVIELS